MIAEPESGRVCLLPGLLVMLGLACQPAVGLTLDEAYTTALENNQEVNQSLQQQLEAQAGVTEAKSRLYPSLEVSGFTVRQKELTQTQLDSMGRPVERTFQHAEDYQYQLELRHHLYTGGKTWSGWSIRAMEAQEESYRHFRRKQEILYDVARSYYDVLLARRNREIARDSLERSRNQLERARGRFEVGELTRTGVLRSEVSVSRAEQELRQARNSLTVSYDQLALALGKDTVSETIETVEFNSMPDTPLKEYYRLALNNRKDLKQARARERVTQERITWEKADYYPNIDLVSQVENRDKPRFSDETKDWNVRLVGTYPLFSGWQETSEVRQARLRNSAAEAAFKRMRRQVRVEIKNLYLELKTQSKVIETARSEVESARSNYEQITAEFEQGLVSSVSVNDALTALSEAENRLANARYNFQLGLLRLKLASGTFQEKRLRTSL
ncbi:MAG: TolC family protein [bacterium]